MGIKTNCLLLAYLPALLRKYFTKEETPLGVTKWSAPGLSKLFGPSIWPFIGARTPADCNSSYKLKGSVKNVYMLDLYLPQYDQDSKDTEISKYCEYRNE